MNIDLCNDFVLIWRITCQPLSLSACTDVIDSWLCFYQTRSAWSMDQGSNKKHSPAYNFAPTVTKFCVMWEGLSLPHDTKFGNCRCEIVDSRAFPSWSLIHGLRWSALIKAEPGLEYLEKYIYIYTPRPLGLFINAGKALVGNSYCGKYWCSNVSEIKFCIYTFDSAANFGKMLDFL